MPLANTKHISDDRVSDVRVSAASKAAARGQAVDLLTPEPGAGDELRKRKADLVAQLQHTDYQLSQCGMGFQDRQIRENLKKKKDQVTRQLQAVKADIAKGGYHEQKYDIGALLMRVLDELRAMRIEVAALKKALGG